LISLPGRQLPLAL